MNRGDKGRIIYSIKLRNVSSVEMDILESIELSFAGGGGTIFQINCSGNDWHVKQGAAENVPPLSTFGIAAGTQLFYVCNGSNQTLPVTPGVQNYGQSPVTLKLSGALKDGTLWFASASKAF